MSIAGARILDLTSSEAAYAGKVLAELGCDVVKIEPPGGHHDRHLGPFFELQPGKSQSLSFSYFNASKRSVTLNLYSQTGIAIFKEMIKRTDVLLENFSPKFLESIQLDETSLRKTNAVLIHTAVTPFGSTGPRKLHQATDLISQSSGGLAFRIGQPHRPPTQMGATQGAYMAGIHGAVATLIALYDREESGLGQFVDVSAQEAVAMTSMEAMPTFDLQKRNLVRTGNKSANGHNHLFPAADGYVKFVPFYLGVGPGLPGLRRWLKAYGKGEELEDPRWDDQIERSTHSKFLEDQVANFTKAMTQKQLIEQGQEHGFMIIGVNTPSDLFRDPQLQSRNFFTSVQVGDNANAYYPGPPARMSATPWKESYRAPNLGENNIEIFQGEIGLSSMEIRALGALGVI